ncbi:TonB-dependent receptor [Phenylobacterium immobile]|uniref:TonB-dependent receptor n=1 Tax=Phenylobacterium immobile TaxID=21 RepID=UPI000AC9CAB9|nr:TonB-dependent receptor [Phenylobacterium immobile]
MTHLPPNKSHNFRRFCIAGASALALSAGAAHAQTVAADAAADGGVEELVVTARSRGERLADIPLTINVIGADAIQKANLKGVMDLSRLAPSFNYIANLRGQAFISMRGLNPNTYNTQKQGVSFFVDGVYIAGEATSFNLQDLERVEVLKGPQSTHFGRSTYAGAINYITRIPESMTVSGRVTAEVQTKNSYDVNGVINVPIIEDKLYASFSGRKFHRGGVFTERNYGGKLGEQDSINLAAAFIARPTDTTSIRFRAMYDEDDDGHQISWTAYRQDMAAFDVTYPTGQTYPTFTIPDSFYRTDKFGNSLGVLPDHGGDRDRRRLMLYAIIDQELPGGYQFNYSGEYFSEYNRWWADATNRWLGDPMLVGAKEVLNPIQNQTRTVAHQIRVSSPAEQKLKWTLGAFHFKDSYSNYAQYGRIVFSPFTLVPDSPRRTQAAQRTLNRAIYGSVSYPILENLNLTAEGRYQSEKLFVNDCDLSFCQRYTAAFSRTEKDFLPRFTLDYKFTPSLLGYALYSEGTKSGIISASNSALTRQAALDFQNANYLRPEYVKNYEVGLKGTLFDRRVSFESAVYQMKVSNQQVSTFALNSAGLLTTTNGNGGQSDIKGAEFSGTFYATPQWDIFYGVGYARHKYTGGGATNSTLINLFGINSDRATLEGLTSQQTPRWTMTGSSEYRIPMGSNQLSFRGDWTYTGERFVDIANLIKLKPYNRLTLSATYTFLDQETDVTLFVNNATGEKTVFDAGLGYGNLAEQPPSPRLGQQPSILINMPYPRTFGLRVVKKY